MSNFKTRSEIFAVSRLSCFPSNGSRVTEFPRLHDLPRPANLRRLAHRPRPARWVATLAVMLPAMLAVDVALSDPGTASPDSPTAMSDSAAVELIREYCIDCHAGDDAESGLDLESFRSSAEIGAAIETWNRVANRVHRVKCHRRRVKRLR